MKKFDPSLYLVTMRYDYSDEEFLQQIEEALKGGVTMLQLREKDCEGGEFYKLALKLRQLTKKYQVTFWINDRVDIALAVEADGVHVGQEDIPAAVVKKIIPENMLLGVSANNLQEALQAEKDGADLLGSGAVFATGTKEIRELELKDLQEICSTVKIPVVGIGGINLDNAKQAMSGGIAGMAIVSALMKAEKPKETAEKFQEIISEYRD